MIGFFFNDVYLIYSVLLVPSIQWNDSVIYISMYTYSFPLRFIVGFEYSSLCYAVGPYCLLILYMVMCIC